jgi:hypothetical protein
MGWFEVINTALNIASTASSVSVASNINKMQKATDAAQNAHMELAQLMDFADILQRKIKTINKHQEKSPQSVLVLSNFYEKALRSLVGSPSSIPFIEARPMFRDLYEDLENLADDSSKSLSKDEINQSNACLNAILEMPDLELAISEAEKREEILEQVDEAESYIKSTEDEWESVSAVANKAKTKKIIGIILLSVAGLATCTVIPPVLLFLFSGSELIGNNFLSGLFSVAIFAVIVFLYIISIILGVFLLIKGKIPNSDRYRELNQKHKEAMGIISRMNTPIIIPDAYKNKSLQELYDLYDEKNSIINNTLGDVGDPKKMLLAEEF